jgi:hypothetical protein
MRSDSQGRGIQIGRYLTAPAVLNVGTVSASVQLLQNRHYRLWPSVDMFFQFGTAGATASTNSHPLTAKLDCLHYTDDTNTTLAAIVSSGTGVLFISEIDAQGV